MAEVRKGSLQPFVHEHNNTTIGQMVKDSYRGQLRAPNLSGLSPLQYLAEIGCQKLSNDYISMFLSKNLVDMVQLDFYVKENQEFQEQLDRLLKLHNTLEIMIMMEQNFDLTQEVLSTICCQVLKYYKNQEININYQFAFSIPTTSIQNVVEKSTPTEWQAQGEKIIKGIPQRLVYHMTLEQPFDWLKLKSQETTRSVSNCSSGDIDDVSYYITIVKDSVSILN